ncbi:MAG: flagellar basal body L-ring protein FlgH [Thermodesulfobacteriota bacterium]|nr:flagellar basal body L-ring protein FlgH [Thermodesulfobacteriota bacterium]
MTHYFFLSLLGVSLFGCATGPKGSRILGKTKPKEVVAINSGVNERHRKEYEGSLWKDDGPLSELFMNPKARRVGDIVTISIVESSSASNNATTNTERASSLSAGMENFFGLESRYPSSHPFFNPFSGVKGDLESAFAGKGTTTRSGDLTAYISARVIEELPNGNLKILGSREVTVNNETQIIALSGIVRPRDISPDNVILSTYISDARITYSGTGIVNDRQGPGWLARIFDTIWPF